MKGKKAIGLIAILLAAACMLCCARVGELSEQETAALHTEIKTDVNGDACWSLVPTYFQEDAQIEDSVAFLRSASEAIFAHEELISHSFGIWYSKKSFSKALTIVCAVPMQWGETAYILDELTVAKYYANGTYKFWLSFRRTGEEAGARSIEVLMQ